MSMKSYDVNVLVKNSKGKEYVVNLIAEGENKSEAKDDVLSKLSQDETIVKTNKFEERGY